MSRVLLLLIVISTLVLSCSHKQKEDSTILESVISEEITDIKNENTIETRDNYTKGYKEKDKNYKLRIIKNADCRIKVDAVEETVILIKQIASKYNGYVSDERFTNTNYSKENTCVIRVPNENFDKVLDNVCELADFIDHKNISAIDVTEEYIDVSSRLKTKLEVQQRYIMILKAKAKTVEDILLTEDKLKELQEEIETAQGRLKYLTNKVSYSTIELKIYETVIPKEEPYVYEPDFLERIREGMSFGWKLLEYLVLILFYVWPFLLLGGVILIYFKWIKR